MPKRFTDTGKWNDPWFRRLPPRKKLAWFYLLDCCDLAGVIDLDRDLAEFCIGETIDWDKFIEESDGRVIRLENGKIWVVKFIEFQYGKLSADCKPHVPVFQLLRRHGISIDDVKQNDCYKFGSISASRKRQILDRDSYTCCYCGASDKELVVDHVTPKSKGGSDKPDNLVAACFDCNSKKSSMDVDDFMELLPTKEYAQQRLSESLSKTLSERIKDKDKDKDKDLEGVQGEIEVECLPSIVEQFAEIWNATPGVTVAATMSQRRVSALKVRLAETINGRPWFEVLKEVCRTKFPLKMSASDTNGWKPDCDWILRPDSVLAIYEGKYDWRKDKRSDPGQDKTAAIAKSRADSLKSHAELQRSKAEAERRAAESRKRAEALEAKFGASLDEMSTEEIRHLARSSLEDSEAAMLLKGYHGGPPGKLLRAALLESFSPAKAPA